MNDPDSRSSPAARGSASDSPVSSHSSTSSEQLQPVELALGPDLLDGADGGVDQARSHAGERVAVAAQDQQRRADGEQDDVEEEETLVRRMRPKLREEALTATSLPRRR